MNTTPTSGPVLVPTIIEFLLDETGSMTSHLSQTISGFADFIDDQRDQDGLCLLTLTKFDSTGLKTPYEDLAIGMVPYLTASTFLPGASTNLNDAIIARVHAREARWRDDLHNPRWRDYQRPRVLFVCMTDGQDNVSRSKPVEVASLLEARMQEDWTFVFLGAYPQAERAAVELGFLPQNIKCFSGAHIRETMGELSVATKAYRAATSIPTDFYA